MNLHHVADALFPFFVAFYVIDAVTPVRTYQTVFASLWGGAYRAFRRGFVLAGLLPSARIYVTSSPPVYFGIDGVYAPDSNHRAAYPIFDPQRFVFIPYADMTEPTVDGGAVSLGTGRRIKLGSSAAARTLKERIERLRAATPQERVERLHEIWNASMNLSGLDATLHANRGIRTVVRSISVAFFALLFLLLPLALYTGTGRVIPVNWILIACACLYTTMLFLTLTHRAALQGRHGGLAGVVAAALSPVTVAHIATQLEKEQLAEFDPVVPAARFLTGERLMRFLRRDIGANRALMRMYPDHPLMACWEARDAAINALIDARDLSRETILGSVRRSDPSAEAFCVVCETEYRTATARCSECGVALSAYRAV